MNTGFFRKNRIYIALLCFIVLINVLSHLEKEEPEEIKVGREAKVKAGKEESDTLFVDFKEAKSRTKRIESILKTNTPLYLFYASFNLSIVLIFFLGLTIIGYFVFNKIRKKDIIQKTCDITAPSWEIGEIFKIIILAFFFSYIFFILMGFFLGLMETAMKTEFAFFKNENFKMIFDTIILDLIVLSVILGFLWNIHRKKLASLGFAKENMAKNIFYGVSGYVAVVPLIIIIGILAYIALNFLKLKPPPQPIVGLFLAEKSAGLIFVSTLIAAIFGPIIEEIFFRGVMYNAVKRKLGIFWVILITSILFSFLHVHALEYFLVGFIPIMILGIVLAYLYEKTGSLIPSITLHILNNVGSVFMVFMYKYFNRLVP